MPTVEVRLLGPLEVGVSGRALRLTRQKQRALLALLALRAGEVVSTDRIVEELWGETPPKAALGSLQNLVSDLRKALGPEALLTRSPGYVLAIDPDQVDVHRFERLAARAQTAGNARERADGLREALALWRGEPLADVAFEPFAQAIARLEELRSSLREDLFEAELDLGQHGSLIGELETHVAEHRLRERPRGQLMLALYRSGRQADALDVYRATREALVEELGIDPSPELQQLEQAILRHDPALGLDRRTTPEQKEPERRKTVTLLFADVVDSTALGAQLDPEVLRSVMGRYFDAVRSAVERHGGVVEKFIGDAAMAAFGIPARHEDDALRAVRAAAELRDALAGLNAELGAERGVVLQCRVGINTGEALVADPGSGEPFATGTAVNVAMRLEQAAPPGEILLGDATYGLVRDAVDAEAVAPLDLGPLGTTRAYRLLRVGPGSRALGSAPLVDRDDELAWLHASYARARDQRRSSVVTVLGDAGLGKTRLASELMKALSKEATTLSGRCVSYGDGATYLPLAEIVRHAIPRRTKRRVALLLAGDEHADLIAERIAELTGEAEAAGGPGEMFWAVRRFLEALAAERPLIVVLEDLHWAEPTLLDLVEYLGAWVSDAPFLVVCLARPELLETRSGWGGGERSLALEPLSLEDTNELVEAIAGGLADESRQTVVETAGGNALFVEQLLAHIDEAGLEALRTVPPTVEALLAGRLDRLDSDERAVLERAAVAGKDFSVAAVLHLSPPAEVAGVHDCLATLERKGLLTEGDEERGAGLRFHHTLVRDVAYAGMTKDARAELHERFSSWLERHGDGVDEIVGYHLEQAYRYRAELRPRDPRLPELAYGAGTRLAAAGMRAFRRADVAATVNLLARAAPLLAGDARRRAEVLCELGVARRGLGQLAAAEEGFTAAAEAAAAAADRGLGLRARIELASLRALTDRDADLDELVELAHMAIELFERLGDDRALGRTWRQVGYVRGAMQGRCAEWLEASERALEHYRRSGWSAAGCLSELGAALFYGPTPVSAGIERCERLLAETADRTGTAHLLVYLAGLQALSARFDEALETLDDGEAILREIGETYALANNSGRLRGRIHVLAGDLEQAERVFSWCCETFERAHDEAALASVASELAITLCERSRQEAAKAWIAVAEEHAPTGDIEAQFAWRTAAGRVRAAGGDVESGHRLALEALAIVERTDTLTHHGGVLLQLAHILRAWDRQAEAAERVEQALALFARKEDAASALRARALLAELAVA
jgi:class 3 adenylate cyclase/tetratricopeptide (TPR) repeat protein